MMRTEKFLTALPLVALAVGALALIMALSLAGCGAPTPDIGGDAPRDQAVTVGMAPVEARPEAVPEGGKVYPLAVRPGEWLKYEIISASNFQLLPGIAVQRGDRVRFEIVGSGTGKKMGLDMTTAVSFETPLCDVYVNGEQVGERVGEEGTIAINVVYPVAVEFWQDYQAVEKNWNETTAAQGLPYHGEIWVESDVVTVDFGYTEPAVIQVQGREGPVDVPIERGVTNVTVDYENENGTGVVLEQIRDASGSQASYHIVLVDSSVMGVR